MGGCGSKGDGVVAAKGPDAPKSGGDKPVLAKVSGEDEEISLLRKQVDEAVQEGKLSDAIQLLRDLMNKTILVHGSGSQLAAVLTELGTHLNTIERYSESLPQLEQALKLRDQENPQSLDTASAANALGICLIHLEKSEEAELYLQRAIDIRTKADGKDKSSTAASHAAMGLCKRKQYAFEAALDSFNEALRIRKKALKASDPAIAATHHGIGQVHFFGGNFQASLDSFEEAHTLRVKHLPREHPDIGSSLVAKGSVLSKLNKTTAAIGSIEEGIAIFEKAGNLKAALADAHNALASVYVARKDFAEAVKHHQSALKIQDEALGPDSLQVALTLYKIGELALGFASPEASRDALASMKRSLQIRQRILGPSHVESLRAQVLLAKALNASGDSDAALKFYEEVATVHRQSDKESVRNHINHGDALQNMGRIYFDQKDYVQAVIKYEEARPIYAASMEGGEDSTQMAALLFNMGLSCRECGDTSQAKSHLQESLEIRQKSSSAENDSSIGVIAAQLADMYEAESEWENALKYHAIAYESRKVVHGDHRLTGASVFAMGRIFRKEKDSTKALENLELASKVFEACDGSDSEDVAIVLSYMGEIQVEQQNNQEAINLYERVKTIREKSQTQGEAYAKTLFNLGVLYDKVGNTEKAKEYASLSAQARKSGHTEGQSSEGRFESMFNQGMALSKAREYDDAIREFEELIKLQKAKLGAKDKDVMVSLKALSTVYSDKQDFTGAVRVSKEALELSKAVYGAKSLECAKAHYRLGIATNSSGDSAAAVQVLKDGLEVSKQIEDEAMVAKTSYEIGISLRDAGELETALTHLQTTGEIWERTEHNEDTLGGLFYTMAEVCDQLEQFEDAAGWYFRASDIWEKTLGEDHPNTAAVIYNLAQAYNNAKEYADAKPYYEKAHRLFAKQNGPEDEKALRAKELAELMSWKAE